MSHTTVLLIGVWLAINFMVVPAIGLLVTKRRRAREARASRNPTAEAYVSILLSRLVMQACRILGVEQTCLLVRDIADDHRFVAAAAHGTADDVIGRRVSAVDALAPMAPIRGGPSGRGGGVAIGARTRSGRLVVLCAAAADRAHLPRQADRKLMEELASLCAAVVEEVGATGHPDRAVRSWDEALAAIQQSADSMVGRSPVDLTSLATRVGERLGLDPGALLELHLAAWVYAGARDEATSTALQLERVPGFQVAGLVIKTIGERWDGFGRPFGLAGDRIPLATRILAPCDAVRACTMYPPYGAGKSIESAIEKVRAASGAAFDPTVVAALSRELLGDVSPAEELAWTDDWADADRLYSLVG